MMPIAGPFCNPLYCTIRRSSSRCFFNISRSGMLTRRVGCAGHFKLATLTQYVPLSAIGGYLGYVGYFCIAAGVALACNVEVRHPLTLPM